MSIRSVPLKIGDQNYQLRYDPASLYAFRKETGVSLLSAFGDEMGVLDYPPVIVWAGLRWRMKSLTIGKISDMISECESADDIVPILEAVGEAIKAAGWLSSGGDADSPL